MSRASSLARLLPLTILLAGAPAPAAAYEKVPSRLARLSQAEAIERIRVREMQDAPHVVISTKKVWDRGRTVDGVHVSDVHLRAMVDRVTGSTRWELWHELDLYDAKREITGLSYRIDGRMYHANLLRTETSDELCPSVDGPATACHVRVRSVFEIPERVLQRVAESYQPGNEQYWELHFSDREGKDIKAGLAPVEAAGLLSSVQHLRCQGIASC